MFDVLLVLWQRMMMDIKLNPMQHSVATLEKLCMSYYIYKNKNPLIVGRFWLWTSAVLSKITNFGLWVVTVDRQMGEMLLQWKFLLFWHLGCCSCSIVIKFCWCFLFLYGFLSGKMKHYGLLACCQKNVLTDESNFGWNVFATVR